MRLSTAPGIAADQAEEVNRLGFSQGHELAAHRATAVALTPDWMRPVAPPGFAGSETTRYVGRAVAALAADPARARYNQRSVTAADLAREYGFTDLDGSQPDGWANL